MNFGAGESCRSGELQHMAALLESCQVVSHTKVETRLGIIFVE